MGDKVTTGTKNFVFFILNVAPAGAPIARLSPSAACAVILVKTQCSGQVKDTSQLINV